VAVLVASEGVTAVVTMDRRGRADAHTTYVAVNNTGGLQADSRGRTGGNKAYLRGKRVLYDYAGSAERTVIRDHECVGECLTLQHRVWGT